MIAMLSRSQRRWNSLTRVLAVISVSVFVFTIPILAKNKPRQERFFWPGNLIVSRSVYDNNPNNVQVGQVLPPNCASSTGGCAASTGAPYDGTYPLVWNDNTYDGSFGITSKIYLDQMLPFGFVINSLEVP